jgi:prepilin-type N-terminal cleavage/methylation domain-containing protein
VIGRAPQRQWDSHRRGFVLLEVMVAIVMLGTLLGALATEAQRAVDTTVRLREMAAGLSKLNAGELELDAWDWGSRITGATWEGGRILKVFGVKHGEVESKVGVWCEGWCLGEWRQPPAEPLALGPAIWDGHTGDEVIVRARVAEGGWGPPWRTVVPNAYGHDSLECAGAAPDPAEPPSYESVQTAVHLLCQCTLLPKVSWSVSPVAANESGITVVLSEHGLGLCRISQGEREQCWVASKGRRLDVYF